MPRPSARCRYKKLYAGASPSIPAAISTSAISTQQRRELGKPDTGNEIAIYAPGASGNDQPTAVLTHTDEHDDLSALHRFRPVGTARDLRRDDRRRQ